MRYTSRGDVTIEDTDASQYGAILNIRLRNGRLIAIGRGLFDALFQPVEPGEPELEAIRKRYPDAEWIVTDGKGNHPFGVSCNGFPGLAVRRDHPHLHVPIIIIQAGQSDMRTNRELWDDVVNLYRHECVSAGVTP